MTCDERAQKAGNGAPLPCQEDNLVRERRVGGKGWHGMGWHGMT
jgi:hypothetical protein